MRVNFPASLFLLRLFPLSALVFPLVCLFAGAPAKAQSPNVPPPDLRSYPKNLARFHNGAKLELSDVRDNASRSLLADDSSLDFPVGEGQSFCVISLARHHTLRYISFLTDSRLESSVTVSVSTRSPGSGRWTTARTIQVVPSKFMYAVDLTGLEARFLKLDFQTSKGGVIACFGIYGDETIADFIGRVGRPDKLIQESEYTGDVNLAALYMGATVYSVSSAVNPDHVHRMIDDDAQTGSAFSPNDETPTAVIDLGASRILRRVALVTSAVPGVFEIWLRPGYSSSASFSGVSENPDSSGGISPENISSAPSEAAGSEVVLTSSEGRLLGGGYQRGGHLGAQENGYILVATLPDRSGRIRKSVDFDPQAARYLMVKFIPDRRVSLAGRNYFVGNIAAFGSIDPGVGAEAAAADTAPAGLGGGRGAGAAPGGFFMGGGGPIGGGGGAAIQINTGDSGNNDSSDTTRPPRRTTPTPTPTPEPTPEPTVPPEPTPPIVSP